MSIITPETHQEDSDGTIWLHVEKTLYCLPRGMLQMHSEIFASIFPMPGQGGDQAEDPVILESILSKEFDYLARYLFVGPHIARWESPPPYENAMLISLLRLGDLYEMEKVRTFAKYHITSQTSISPAQKISLARMYTIPEWVEPAVKLLVHIGLLGITDEDTTYLGLVTYRILARAQAEIGRARLCLSLATPPAVCDEHCGRGFTCGTAWKEFWWTKVRRWLNHLHNPPHISNLCDHVDSIFPVIGMDWACQEKTITNLRGMTALRVEDEITEAAVKAVLDYNRSLEL
ncbi:hypothetical protein BDY19DRAFT_903165 [Irpex rosettiformis]|uniref:Uncharacterized protein n=1 Tax=Irpex rosettiformis TaxID=378272 RepID=A0ACB8UGR6_9APHY|nr:hypothetical protein BDY19DRAFT_903165 [Irpex rosettiformis]